MNLHQIPYKLFLIDPKSESISSMLLLLLLLRHLFILLTFSLLVLTIDARSIDDGVSSDIADAAIDLNGTSFNSILKSSPASFAIVEFFAHWCPACRNYKPHYEKVARLFNGQNAVHPGIILMTRVDCADKINTDLCDKFSVGHYPMLLWGSPIKFTAGRWDSKQENSGIVAIDDARTAERLLNWINKKIGSSFGLEDEKFENEISLSRNASDPDLIVRAIYDVEEATANAFEIIVDNKMIKADSRAPLIKFFQLLVAHHPSQRCRTGTAELLVNIDDILPSNSGEVGMSVDRDVLKTFSICGKGIPRGYWIFCRGSKNETRGFSCGLWVLLHSLSVRAGDGESHFAFTAICDFIQNFFVCDECRMHFGQMCSSVTTPFNTTQSLALWLWNAHNKVNERLMKEEKDLHTGDPSFPKIIWPPKQLCPSCYLSQSRKSGVVKVDWNKDEVFKFLVQYYGNTLAASSKDKRLIKITEDGSNDDEINASTHAVTVPVGAALAIALASCAFGALACFWRTRQKNRKPRKNWQKVKTEMSTGVVED